MHHVHKVEHGRRYALTIAFTCDKSKVRAHSVQPEHAPRDAERTGVWSGQASPAGGVGGVRSRVSCAGDVMVVLVTTTMTMMVMTTTTTMTMTTTTMDASGDGWRCSGGVWLHAVP